MSKIFFYFTPLIILFVVGVLVFLTMNLVPQIESNMVNSQKVLGTHTP